MFQEDTSPQAPTGSGLSKGFGIVLTVIVVAAIGAFGYINYSQSQRNKNLDQQIADLQQKADAQAANLTAMQSAMHMSDSQLAKLSSTASEVQRNVAQTAAQLAAAQKQANTLADAAQQNASEIAAVKQQTGTQIGNINGQLTGVQGDVSSAKTDIASTKADLDATKNQLKTAIGDLGMQSGRIATTEQELDALKKSGERSYTEFKLTKTKTPVRVGPVSLLLTKIDAKKDTYTLDLIADDVKIEKKDKTLNEPVQFFLGGNGPNRQLSELVVFQMDKNQVTGYVSSPKYPAQASSSAAASSGGN